MSTERDQTGIPEVDETFRGEHPRTDFERDDERWDLKNQMRDWGILLAMMIVYLTWAGILYFFEPGIR